MEVTPAELTRLPWDGSSMFSPYGTDLPRLEDYDYVQEEWIATGMEDEHPYATTLCVRRPRDSARFSGTVIAEPLHVHGIAPIWMYCGPYLLRSGHAWVEITAQKTTLDMHVMSSNPERYASLGIAGPDSSDFDPNPRLGDPKKAEHFWSELDRRNRATSAILAQVGAALRTSWDPVEGWDLAHLLLTGHSQTGNVTTSYIHDAHHALRLAGKAPIFDGFFPSGFPLEAFHEVGVPVVQVMSDGDVARPDYSFRPGYEGRQYRRDDSDRPGDQYRLYELAGVPHMGTRYAPYNDVSLWNSTFAEEAGVTFGPRMNSLPHFELFRAALRHLVEWVAKGVTPPRATRIEVSPTGFFAKDEHGNSREGVRCAQLDVPHATYQPNPLQADGTPSYLTVGTDEPFDAETMRALYGSPPVYVEKFNRRLDELIDAGWILAEDVHDSRSEAEAVSF